MLFLFGTISQASIIFTLGNNPSNDVNILLNSGATGTTVTGSPNGFPGIIVNFTSSQTLLEPSNGQARVVASPEGTPLTNLAISLADNLTYGDLIINPFIGGQCPDCTGGTSTITVNALNSNGIPEAPAIFTGLNVGNGNNFLTIVASGGESIVSTSISVPGGINDLRQPRISGPFTAPVPEPASYLLIAFGLAGIALLGRKRAQQPE
ncbi:MAG TPA: PEP-CTERM sorting domain-containing protein [Bryobacteraceae bacterium]|nr:PEP-CTERM sorting domain-containing protein [Bryobacteraceae bacterium]